MVYASCGFCTSVINIFIYRFFYEGLEISNVISTALAWTLTFLIAFVLNKTIIFEKTGWGIKTVATEFAIYLALRVGTLFLDTFAMFLAVDCQNLNPSWSKFFSSVFCGLINYYASKLGIFSSKAK